jgi:predicted lysophospholipase L1 biosynthesis ABC-type transport system permease subunit
MARPVDAANQTFSFVELKGVEPPFPLVGTFHDDRRRDSSITVYWKIAARWSRPVLLEKSNLKIGDRIRVGEADFEIRATIRPRARRQRARFSV